MRNSKEIEKLLEEIVNAQCEYYRLKFDEEYFYELSQPATPKQIEKLEGILGKPLPPSYRAFLELHNGWTNFHADGKLLAVEDHSSEWVKKKLKYWSNLWDEDVENPFNHGAIPILLGESLHHFLVLDPRRIRENGNMDFVVFDFMHEEASYKDFVSFLQHELEILRKLIDIETKGVTDEEEEDETGEV